MTQTTAPAPTLIMPVQIADHTDVWGREEDGHHPIYVRDEFVDGGETKHMVTQWQPTEEQLKALQSGASIFLSIVGYPDVKHPPVHLAVAYNPPVDVDPQRDPSDLEDF